MRYRDLPSGTLFQFSAAPGAWETAIKAGQTAYSLKTGQVIDIHANHKCDELQPLTGDRYRLGVMGNSKELVIFSQANGTHFFVHEFRLIGHAPVPRDAVTPIIGRVELNEQQELVNIILTALDEKNAQVGHCLQVLRDGLHDGFQAKSRLV